MEVNFVSKECQRSLRLFYIAARYIDFLTLLGHTVIFELSKFDKININDKVLYVSVGISIL